MMIVMLNGSCWTILFLHQITKRHTVDFSVDKTR